MSMALFEWKKCDDDLSGLIVYCNSEGEAEALYITYL